MNELYSSQELSKYNKYILDKIIPGFSIEEDFNIYNLVEEAVLHKCILPSQNELVMETYYALKDYLLQRGFILEHVEMTAYKLTTSGKMLKAAGSWRKYEEQELKKDRWSFLNMFFKKSKQVEQTDKFIGAYHEP